jgi:heptosyltransferase III
MTRSQSTSVQKLFVYRPGAIGDTVLTLPALGALRKRFPGCEITFAGNPAMLPLLAVEEALSADDRRLLPLFGEPARGWPGADAHVVFAKGLDGLNGIRRDPLEAVGRGVHVADWLVDAIDPLAADRQPRLNVEAAGGAELVIHPGAGGAAKRWPASRFAELAHELGLVTAVVRGPADPDFQLEPAHETWDNLPLPELVRRLKGSRLFVGNDSGITHLAAAVGTPTVAIYVSTNPEIWGVRGAHTRRLSGAATAEETAGACLALLH